MSFDRDALARAVAAHGTVARVVVAEAAGSAPREAGAAMLVWPDGQSGSIGGGALELAAAGTARTALAVGRGAFISRAALGPALGQCCGGAVVLVTEFWDAARLAGLEGGAAVLRRVEGTSAAPLALRRAAAAARSSGTPVALRLAGGWLLEPETVPQRQLWVWGAGHVGRALVAVLEPLPGVEITWLDTAAGRFPAALPGAVLPVVAADPGPAVARAPAAAEHLVLTYSHALDLEICHLLLGHGFGAAGLIGSATKWARFRARLAALGHRPESIARIRCPIGRVELGKHPQAIAVGVAADFLAAGAGAARHEAREASR